MPRLDQAVPCAPRKWPMLKAATHTVTGSSVCTIALGFLLENMGRLPALRLEGHTLELNNAHPIRLRTDENKAHRGTKYTGELPPEWRQGLPPPHLPKRPTPGKKSPGPSPPP